MTLTTNERLLIKNVFRVIGQDDMLSANLPLCVGMEESEFSNLADSIYKKMSCLTNTESRAII